jgi:hypothetical protein
MTETTRRREMNGTTKKTEKTKTNEMKTRMMKRMTMMVSTLSYGHIFSILFDCVDMGDSDKDRDEEDGRAGKGTKMGGKRKRKNTNYADMIGFPKDKVVLKRVEMLINLVLNPPSESTHHSFEPTSNKRKQTSIGDFTSNGREKFAKTEGNDQRDQQPGTKERLPPGRRPKPGGSSGSSGSSGRGRGGRGGGRGGRGGSQNTAQNIKEEKQKSNRIAEYMLSDNGRDEKKVWWSGLEVIVI